MAQPKATHARLVLSPNAVVIEAGDRVQYRAEGYDDAGKYRGDVTPDTTFSVGKDVCKRAICTANPGTYTVTGTFYINDTAITGTAHLLVLPRPLASLKLRPNPAVIEAGGSRDYTAEGLDKAGRSLGDLTAYTRFSISPDGSCKNATCTPADPGRHTVTGTVDLGKRQVTGTADLLVLGPLARVTLQPNPATIIAGATVTYTARGEDADRNPRDDVTANTSFSISPDGSCAGATCIATKAGDHTVPATVDAGGRHVTAMAELHVVAGPLASLTLRPSPATIVAGAMVTYTARGEDANGNPRGDVTADTSFSISPDGSCTGATCTAAGPGRHTVIGTAIGSGTGTGSVDVGGSQVTGTAELLVLPRPLASLTLRPDLATITADGSSTYAAEGLDAAGRDLGDVTADTSFSISPDGSCAGATCTATRAGDHTVTAVVDAGGRQITATAELRVVAGPLASMTLRPNPATVTAGAMVTYTARGEDADGNPRGDVTADTSFSISPDGSCAGATCTAAGPGPHTVSAAAATGGHEVTGTAELLVLPRPLARLTLRPDPATIEAGGSRTYAAEGLDAAGRDLGDVTAETRFSISPDGACAGATCTATRAGDHTVTAAVDAAGRRITGTAELRVVAGPLASMTLRPDPATITAHGSRTYTAHGLDVAGRDLGDVTAGTRFSIRPDGSCTGATCTATKAGNHTVIGTVDIGDRKVIAIASLHVTAFTSASFITKKSPSPPWLLFAIGALALLVLAAGTTTAVSGHARHQRQWVRQHVRAELHSTPGSVTLDREDPHIAPTFAVRLQPHRDSDTQIMKEGE